MTPTNKAVREALEAAYWFINASERELDAIGKSRVDYLRVFHELVPSLEYISLLDAEPAGVGGAHPQIDGLDDAINNSVMYPMVNDVGFQSEHDRRVVMQAARRYLALTAPAEPEAEGEALITEEKPHTTLGDIIDFVSENAADLVNKKVCPSDSRDKDLIAVRDAISDLMDAVGDMPADPSECWPDEWESANNAIDIVNRMIEGGA